MLLLAGYDGEPCELQDGRGREEGESRDRGALEVVATVHCNNFNKFHLFAICDYLARWRWP